MIIPIHRLKQGRGANTNPDNRFESLTYREVSDGWDLPVSEEDFSPLQTTLHIDKSRTIVNYNDSPDIPFDRSINPYRGCEHGCSYCYARPSHAYLGFSPGLDFETQLLYKPDAPELLAKELSHPSYQCQSITLGSNTDPYQPTERKLGLTRRILEVLSRYQHPVHIITRSDLIVRDLDILREMAKKNLVAVYVSVTTLDQNLARDMEPRAVTPKRRLFTLTQLATAGIPTTVMTSPMIPGLNDHELETIMQAAKVAGASRAYYTLVRLAYELKELFTDWLQRHRPDRAERVLNLLRECYGGKLYDAKVNRMRGSGTYAELLQQRYEKAHKRLGFLTRGVHLDTKLFIKHVPKKPQLSLWE